MDRKINILSGASTIIVGLLLAACGDGGGSKVTFERLVAAPDAVAEERVAICDDLVGGMGELERLTGHEMTVQDGYTQDTSGDSVVTIYCAYDAEGISTTTSEGLAPLSVQVFMYGDGTPDLVGEVNDEEPYISLNDERYAVGSVQRPWMSIDVNAVTETRIQNEADVKALLDLVERHLDGPEPTESATETTEAVTERTELQISSTGAPMDEAPVGEVVAFGFGRDGSGYIRGMVVVSTDSATAIGEFATVNVNFLDGSGGIVATEEQVEVFNWVGQELAFPFLVEDRDAEIVSMDPVVTFSDYGTGGPSRAPLPVLEATEIGDGESGGFEASFEFTNETDENLASLRVGVVCYNEAGTVVGGDTEYPGVPLNGTIRIDADVRAQTRPVSCRAFLNYGD